MFFKFKNFKIIIDQIFELQNEKRVIKKKIINFQIKKIDNNIYVAIQIVFV